MILIRACIALTCLSLGSPCLAYSSYGTGNLSCKEYIEKRAEDQSAGEVQNTLFVHAYLAGYLTAGNMMRGLVGDETGGINIDLHRAVQWLDAHCLKHEDKRVAVALEAMWVEAARAKRLLEQKKEHDAGRP